MELGEDEILRCRAGEYLQLVQPKEFHRMVHYELHQEMAYLGWERTSSLKLSNKSANTVATRLHNDFVLRFMFQTCIHHDHSSEFENNLFKHL